jgi:hypothetical protein
MAQKSIKTRDPMKHKTGKPRLGPLNLAQLEDLLAKTAKKKDRAKIANRIRTVRARNPLAPTVAEAAPTGSSNSVEQSAAE